MKRQDKFLNPTRPEPERKERRICGAPLPDGGTCQKAVRGDHPCRLHGGPAGYSTGEEKVLEVEVPVVFSENQAQGWLVEYVREIQAEYGLNTAADLRQTILAGVAYVRILLGGSDMNTKDLNNCSLVVDRHLRNLRATPKEQRIGRSPGSDGDNALGAGMEVGALMERVRVALTPGQVADLASGRIRGRLKGILADSGAEDVEAEEILDDLEE